MGVSKSYNLVNKESLAAKPPHEHDMLKILKIVLDPYLFINKE